MPYPPDVLPGGRIVESPYGSIKVFEWGPSGGERVLLLHGISTPCLALGDVAEELVSNGFRVMLFGKRGLLLRSYGGIFVCLFSTIVRYPLVWGRPPRQQNIRVTRTSTYKVLRLLRARILRRADRHPLQQPPVHHPDPASSRLV